MKIKATISFILSLIILLSLTACNKSELNISGDDTYIYNEVSSKLNSDETLNSDSLDIFEYNTSEINNSDKLDWKNNDSGDAHIFYIKNSSGMKINHLAYRPSGYDVFKRLNTYEIEANLDFVKVTNANLSNYELFDFIIVTEDGITTIFNDIAISGQRGIEITYLHSNYGFEYIK